MQTPDAANIASVVLVRPGTPTHAFDMEQRLVGLSYTVGSGVLNVTSPPNGNIAPPGYYMLFVLNSAGVPSVARFVRLSASAPNQAPVATITSPAANVTRNPGGAVSFAGTGSDPDGTISAYAWTFPGGAPASSSVASPGNVTYSDAGNLRRVVPGDGQQGACEPARNADDHRLRLLAVGDTGIANRRSREEHELHRHRGAGERVHRNRDLQRDRSSFRRDGAFTPASVTTSGSTTLNVSTSAATPPGSYPLTIRGTSGPVTRTVNVTLVVDLETSRSRRRRRAGRSPGAASPPTT